MTSKNFPRFLLGISFICSSFTFYSQCSVYASAVPDVTLQCTGGTFNRSAVAFYPTQRIYYSVNEGSTSNPIETFSITGGSHLSSFSQTANYCGFWYNPGLGILEGNVPSQSAIIQHSINPVNSYALGTTSLQALAGSPSIQSCGQFDPVNNEVIYYNATSIYRYNRNTGALISTIGISGLPFTSINANGLVFTGIANAEVGIYDYVQRKIYFINYITGTCTGSCQLPLSAPTPSSLGMSYANNRLFLFDNTNLCWYGYKLSNKPDLYFNGYNILCRYQEEYISIGQNYQTHTFVWAPAYALLGNLPSGAGTTQGVAISSPTVSTIYSATVTNSSGCSTGSSFVMTVYPNIINNNTSITSSTNSLFCTNLTSVTLTASGQLTYSWSSNFGYLNSTTNSIVVNPTVTTSYGVVGCDTLGCRSILRSLTVTVYGGPTVTVLSTHSLLCGNQTATFTANGADSYTWSNNSTTSTIVVSPTITSSYLVVGENSLGCKYSATKWINVGHTPTLIPKGTSILCRGPQVESHYINVSGAISYTWNTGDLFPSILVQPQVTTSYTVTGISRDGCTSNAVITVTVVECMGIQDIQSAEQSIKIYPNPNNGEFKINLSMTLENTVIEIYNSLGSSVYRQSGQEQEFVVDLKNLPSGLYILIYSENEKKKFTRKILKE